MNNSRETQKGGLTPRLRVVAMMSILLCLAGMLASTMLAAGRRGFAGFYQTKVTDLGPRTVSLTLTIRLFNHTGADLSDGTLKVHESLPPHNIIGTLKQISLEGRGGSQVSGELTVPRAEYLRWQHGSRPEFTIEYQDAGGKLQTQSVELARGCTGIEEQ